MFFTLYPFCNMFRDTILAKTYWT